MSGSLSLLLILSLFGSFLHAKPASPEAGDSIVLIGNGLGERMLDHPYFQVGLYERFPSLNLTVRNQCRPGDTAGFRPHPSRATQWAFPGAEKFHPQHAVHAGKGHHPYPDEWLTMAQADTILAFFGYNESFEGEEGIERFRGEIAAFVDHTKQQKYNGEAAPRLVLLSPISYEDLSAVRDLPDGKKENQNLARYAETMREVAKEKGVEFIDLFAKTSALYESESSAFTRNGFLPNDAGYAKLAPFLLDSIFGASQSVSKADSQSIRAAVLDKNWHYFNDFRMLNGVHVDGRRFRPFGPKNYPDEQKKLREMTVNRDQAIWAVIQGEAFDLAAADAKTHPLPEVETNYRPSKKNGVTDYADGKLAEKKLETPEGYKVELFASEKDFPNLANPMQISFDTKGRMWVSTMPSYPHWRPGDPKPDDKILIYEDLDGDGKADKEIVFADGLSLPIGFEIVEGGVYVSQEPHLVFLPDANGDDKADGLEVVLTGFDSHDTHHAIGAFTADPSGAIMMCEGIFLHSNVETPYGPVRGVDGGFYRFSPQRTQLERTTQVQIPNPWGFAFDQWGQDFFIHTSGPAWNWNLPVSLKGLYGAKAPRTKNLVPKGQAVRPTSGLEFIHSRHFPDEVQGDALIGNCIGFLGVKQHSITDDGTGYKAAFRHNLLSSNYGNFRPADLEFAPDGSLYVVDWQNVLIGHMQHNARDPLRDADHGRIYRITYPARDLVKPAEIDGAPIATLFKTLELPEYRTRYRTRSELRGRAATKVLPAVKVWVNQLDEKDTDYERLKLEALWVTWGANQVSESLLTELLSAEDFRVRSAAVRVLRYNLDRVPNALEKLKKAAGDSHGRVRLEAAVAATWLANDSALEIVKIAENKGTDKWSQNPIKAAKAWVQKKAIEETEENPLPKIPKYLTKPQQRSFKRGHEVYFRDAHCATCHQSDGKGLEPAFPPLKGSIYVTGSPERLLKLTIHGLMGPLEVNGKKYAGQVPMTPFGGMLEDQEIADVLTYIRNRFGNKAEPITAAQVLKVRKATKGQQGFYQTDQLLKEHPLEK